ncbi:MAG: hypothetical protein ACYDG2_19725 [Ruminiclostridium sp.]
MKEKLTYKEEGNLIMKKFLLVLATVVFLLSFTSCNTDQSDTKSNNSISETQLTDREKMFLSIGGNEYFIFDFKVDSQYNWVEVWVDRYEFGKKVSIGSKLSAGLSKGKEGMIVTTVNELEKMKQTWTIIVNNDGAKSTIKSSQEYKVVDYSSFSKIWGTNTSKIMPVNDKEIILADICYKDQSKDNTMYSLTDKFYSNPEENIKEIENYDLVYLLKCKFYENKPN